MKRLFSILCVLIVLLSVCVIPLPVSAEDNNAWKKLTYTLHPKKGEEEPVSGVVEKDAEIPGNCTIHWDPALTDLMVDGRLVAEQEFRIDEAGEYELRAIDKANPTSHFMVYKIRVLPDINLVNGQVFTSYPTIVCTNASSMKYMKGTGFGEDFVSGGTIREFGSHLITVNGRGKNNSVVPFEYRFYVKACHAERVFDQASGKEALNIIVGSFDDKTIEATLDGTRVLAQGSNIETKVGQHTLDILVNGEPLTSPQSRPGSNSLMLRVDVYVDAQESKDPYYFDFSRWDADVLLDGRVVKDVVRIGKHGKHTLAVLGADGQVMEGGLNVTIGEQGKPQAMTELSLTFLNPHILYAIIVAVPAAILLAAAGYFLVVRRRIV